MDKNVIGLSNRFQKLKTEAEIQARKQAEEAAKAYKALHSIRPEDVTMLSSIDNRLSLIMCYTVQDIQDNLHGERETIHAVKKSLEAFLEERLAYYEGKL